jgi:hypothetical protein
LYSVKILLLIGDCADDWISILLYAVPAGESTAVPFIIDPIFANVSNGLHCGLHFKRHLPASQYLIVRRRAVHDKDFLNNSYNSLFLLESVPAFSDNMNEFVIALAAKHWTQSGVQHTGMPGAKHSNTGGIARLCNAAGRRDCPRFSCRSNN